MKNNKGFSLVELIVVIAIMAILVGVAVPVYSSYVEKAQKASDIQMVDEIKHALQVYYASNPTDFEGGYIVLKNDGNPVISDALIAVIENTFGGSDLTLSYTGWNTNQINSLWNLVGQYQNGEEGRVLGSSFLNDKITTESMMNTVNVLLESASNSIAGTKAETLEKLSSKLGFTSDELTELNKLANDANVSKAEFDVAVSNALVGLYAGKINADYTAGSNHADADPIVNLLYVYANAYAYSELYNDPSYFDAVHETVEAAQRGELLKGDDGQPLEGIEALKNLGSLNTQWDKVLGSKVDNVGAILDEIDKTAEQNIEALKIMMGAIDQVADSHNNANDLLNGNLYGDASVVNQIDAYKNIIKIKAALGGTLPAMGANDVIVIVLEDGTVFSSISE